MNTTVTANTTIDPGEHAAEFGKYIALVPPGDVQAILDRQLQDFTALLEPLTDEQAMVKHAPYTWTIKQVVGHMTDCERVFGCRVLRVGRNDQTPLTTFDEAAYMQHADFDRCPIQGLVSEFKCLRRSHLKMIRHFPAEAWNYRGVVLGQPASLRAMVYVLAGHAKHHLGILHKRLSPAR
ncbi:MAG TPA: DinB family protein [Pirellulales bacterium]|jgi:hypothetical protein